MTTLKIQIPEAEVEDITNYIIKKGGNLIRKTSYSSIKSAQLASLKRGLTEALLITRGDIKGTPLAKL